MATTYDVIIAFLNDEGLDFIDLRKDNKDGLLLQFADSEDDKSPEIVVIRVEENGNFVRFFEPMRYRYLKGEHKEKVLQTLLAIQFETKLLQWEYDLTDGEVRACVELPLEDAKLTKRLFMRVLLELVKMMDSYHERIKKVMATGEDSGPVNPKSRRIVQLEESFERLQTKKTD